MLIALVISCMAQEPGLWDGFELGSWVRMSSSRFPESAAPPRHLSRVERVDGGLSEDAVSVSPLTRRVALLDGFKEVSRERETLTIRDRAVACDVLRFAPAEPAPGRSVALTLWRAADVAVPPRELYGIGFRSVPVDVVALTLVEETPAAVWVGSLRVVDLDAPLDVAGRRLSCTAEQGSSVWQSGARYTRRDFTRWLSAEVPGSVVRRDRDCTDKPGRPAHSYTARDQVADFHVVR